MIYLVKNLTQKQKKDGSFYQSATLVDQNNQEYENVSAWNNEFREGQSVEGQIETKGNYLNFKSMSSIRPSSKSAQMSAVMEKKAEQIERTMDRKEQAIAHAGAITNATNLVKSMLEAKVWANVTEDMVKNKVRDYIAWYKAIYENPNNIIPSSKEPF